jgi:hypothetical protein
VAKTATKYKGFVLLSIHACHGAAFFGTFSTGFRTTPAMVHVVFCMLFTFIRTNIAYFSARVAKSCGMFTANRH